MERAINIYQCRHRLAFYSPDRRALPVAQVVAGYEWEHRPYLDDGFLILPKFGIEKAWTAGEILVAARLGWFGLKVWTENRSGIKADGRRRRVRGWRRRARGPIEPHTPEAQCRTTSNSGDS